jgi:hypothetical protein
VETHAGADKEAHQETASHPQTNVRTDAEANKEATSHSQADAHAN